MIFNEEINILNTNNTIQNIFYRITFKYKFYYIYRLRIKYIYIINIRNYLKCSFNLGLEEN